MCRAISCIALLAICAAMVSNGVLIAHEKMADDPAATATEQVVTQLVKEHEPKPVQEEKLPDFMQKSVVWLIAALHNDGGWGGGSHAQQNIRDTHAVTTDHPEP
jgi:hypothetical protein